MKTFNNSVMNTHNKSIILRYLYKHGEKSIQEISRYTKLTVAGVSKIIKKLQDDNLICKSEKSIPTYGKHQGFWIINKNYQYFLCICITSKQINSVIVDFVGTPLSAIRSDNNSFNNEEEFVQKLVHECQYWQKQYPSLQYVGISITGIVDNNKRNSNYRSLMNIQDEIALLPILESQTDLQIKMDNDCNIMMLAEKWFGDIESEDNVLLLHLDYGIGAAFLKNGNIFRGARHSAVQFGHMSINTHGKPCTCGSQGCVEAYANEDNLIHDTHYESIAQFYQGVLKKETIANERYKQATHCIGSGMGALINLYEPSKIILRGSFLQGNGIHNLISICQQYSINTLYQYCEIIPSTLSIEQTISGCALLWVEDFIAFKIV